MPFVVSPPSFPSAPFMAVNASAGRCRTAYARRVRITIALSCEIRQQTRFRRRIDDEGKYRCQVCRDDEQSLERALDVDDVLLLVRLPRVVLRVSLP